MDPVDLQEPPVKVPPRNWPATFNVQDFTVAQERFFRIHFKPAVMSRRPLDVGRDSVYPMAMAQDAVAQYDADPGAVEHVIESLYTAYGAFRYAYALRGMQTDLDFLAQRWQKCFDEGLSRDRGGLLLAIPHYLASDRVTARDVIRWCPTLTKATYSHFGEFVENLQIDLDRFHLEIGRSMLADFWQVMASDEPVEAIAESMRGRVGPDLTDEDVIWSVERQREHGLYADWLAFTALDGMARPIPGLERSPKFGAFGYVWEQYVKRFIRHAENTTRESAGLPRVGEGNVAEVRLLRSLQLAFPDETINHQARPVWLAPQSLDIVFTHRNIAIEYQGAQHTRPVEFFGGAEAFEIQKQRDVIKRSLCERNGMTLLEVFPDYDLGVVVKTIRELLDEVR